MSPNVRRALLNAMAGLVVLLGSFWVTLKILDYRTITTHPNADLIQVTDATYGMSCQAQVARAGRGNAVKPGNVTAAVAAICAGTRKLCSFVIEANRIGDPAPGCGKDMFISWQCGVDPTVRRIYVAAEADSQRASLACP